MSINSFYTVVGNGQRRRLFAQLSLIFALVMSPLFLSSSIVAEELNSDPCQCAVDCSISNEYQCDVGSLPWVTSPIIPKFTNVSDLEICRCHKDCKLAGGLLECRSVLETKIYTSTDLFDKDI